MNLVAAARSAWSVLQSGKELRNAEGWKNAQIWTSILLAMLGLSGAIGIPVPALPGDFASSLGVVMAGVANAYLTAGTSTRVGIAAPPSSPPGAPTAVVDTDDRRSKRFDLPELP